MVDVHGLLGAVEGPTQGAVAEALTELDAHPLWKRGSAGGRGDFEISSSQGGGPAPPFISSETLRSVRGTHPTFG